MKNQNGFWGLRCQRMYLICPVGLVTTKALSFNLSRSPQSFEAPLERLLVDRALGIANLAIRIGLAVLNIWGALRICGIGVTLKMRAHRISSGDRHLHQEYACRVSIAAVSAAQIGTTERRSPRLCPVRRRSASN